MKKFLFIYRSPIGPATQEPTPAEMQAEIKLWWDWLGAGQAAGWVVAMGDPLTQEGRIVHADSSITDGPYTESKEMIGGYSIIQAGDYDEACKHAMGCPIYAAGGHVEIREIMQESGD